MAAHQSLYRKHRPQAFGELVGQEHVSVALRNAVREGRVGHAYLFSGPRGTGKTTTARLLAKALNCLDLGADGEPCCRCENCVAVAGGRFPDLFELDAASNNRVDDIRELNDRVHLGMGASSKRKVYIVDEVHELTDRAANAFLKTLEEPPEHVVFVLATTNPEKVLPTIRSRTQHYDFTLLTTEQLVGHLAEVLGREGVEAEPEALAVVARRAGGSARDALSLLDQALAHGTGRLDTEQVLALFGGTPFELRCAVLDAVAGEDPAGALVALGALVEAGHDPRRVAEDLLRSLRDAFLLEAARGRVVPEGPPEERARLEALAGTLGRGAVVRGLETLGQAVVDMRGADAADPQLVLEVALVRMARRDAGTSLDALTDRVERLERALAGRSGDAPPAPGPSVPPAPPERTEGPPAEPGGAAPGPRLALGALRRNAPATPAPPPATTPPAAAAPTPASPGADPAGAGASAVDLDDVIVAWAGILPGLPVATRSSVQEAQPIAVEDDVVVFGVPPRLLEAARPRFQKAADTIRASLTERLGRTLRFRIVAHDGFTAPLDLTDRSDPGGPPGEPPDEPPDEVVDPAELVDAPPGNQAVDTLVERFGAVVVEERPRETGR